MKRFVDISFTSGKPHPSIREWDNLGSQGYSTTHDLVETLPIFNYNSEYNFALTSNIHGLYVLSGYDFTGFKIETTVLSIIKFLMEKET